MPEDLNLNPAATPKPKSRKRFWIWITIFCSLGILVLLAIAAPCMVKPRGTAQANTCIANLKQIDGAKEQWMLENKKTTNDVPIWADLIGTDKYIKNTPSCPSHGKYTLNDVSKPPVCSLGKSVTPPHVLPQ
jgi:hypothetical protein